MDIKYWLKSEGYLIKSIDSWSAGESLVIGDIRLDSGAYFCIAPHTSSAANEPGVGGTWATYWKALAEVTSTDAATHFTADDTTPYYRLVDGSDNDLAIRLNAGVLQIYDNGASALLAALTMSSKALALEGALSVAGVLTAAEKTDHQIALDIAQGIGTVGTSGALGGTWTVSEGASDNIQIVTRSAAAADHYYRVPIPLPKRTAASKGAKLQSVTMSYVIGGTIDAANDILQLHILKQTLPADGSGATASILAGDVDADYDAAHDTAAERMVAGSHTLTVTIPSGEQAYAAALETFAARVRVKDASTANLTFVLTGLVANYAAAEY